MATDGDTVKASPVRRAEVGEGFRPAHDRLWPGLEVGGPGLIPRPVDQAVRMRLLGVDEGFPKMFGLHLCTPQPAWTLRRSTWTESVDSSKTPIVACASIMTSLKTPWISLHGPSSEISRRNWIGRLLVVSVASAGWPASRLSGQASPKPMVSAIRPERVDREVEGWTVRIDTRLWQEQRGQTDRALELLALQLREIVREVPPTAVGHLRRVTLWFTRTYPSEGGRAEYHPGADWLRDHGRDPAMVRGVEFTDIPDFESETRRMPNFTLHELAHAYHDRVLPGGFSNPEIAEAYRAAKAGGRYERVQRKDASGKVHWDRAYAMTNAMEYFAEGTEAFFSRNDFFPFNRGELRQHDPGLDALLSRLWGRPG